MDNQKIENLYNEIVGLLEDIDPADGYEDGSFEKVMEYFCSNYDKGYGFKTAIAETLTEQYNHHREDLTVEELQTLLDILNKK